MFGMHCQGQTSKGKLVGGAMFLVRSGRSFRAAGPNENVDDGRLDVKMSSPGTPGTGTTPEMHHSPTATCVFFHEAE
jgi:hypothetical protein